MKKSEHTPENEKAAKEIMTDFFISYVNKPENLSDWEWLKNKLCEHLADKPPSEIENFCEELFQTQSRIDELTADICSAEKSEYRAEIWMYQKLLTEFAEDDEEYFQNLCCNDRILTEINEWLVHIADELKRINFEKNRMSYDDDDLDEFENDFFRQEYFFPVKNLKKSSRKKILTKESIGNSLNKSIFNQFQRTAKTDLGHIDLRGRDFDEIAVRIGKNAALNGVGGIAVTTMLTIVMQGGFRRAGVKEIINLLLKTGASQSLRTVTSGALKVIAEKGTIPILTKSTPLVVIAALAGIAIESSKIIWKYERGQIGIMEAMDRIGRISTSVIFAVGFGSVGGVIGVAAFSLIPVAGPLIGGIIGSLIGELSGNLLGGKLGNFSYSKAKKLISVVSNAIKVDAQFLKVEPSFSTVLTPTKLKRKNLLSR